MKLRIDPVVTVCISILLAWGWAELMNEPVCQVEETHNGKLVLVPKLCSDVLEN